MGDRKCENPTRAKISHPLGSEVHVQAGQPEYEAGRSKNPGSVLSPKNGIVVVIGIHRSDNAVLAYTEGLYDLDLTTGACLNQLGGDYSEH